MPEEDRPSEVQGGVDTDSGSDTLSKFEQALSSPKNPVNHALIAILRRHGVATSRFISTIEELTGLPAYGARRRLQEQSPWTDDDVRTIATHFGEDAAAILASTVHGQPPLPGRIEFGDISLSCSYWADQGEPSDQVLGPWVAVPPPTALDHDPWIVMPIEELADRRAISVRALYVDFTRLRRRVAVVDDEPSVADSLSTILRLKGFEASAFTDVESFQSAQDLRGFDAFIVDWVLGTRDARDLISWIRRRDAAAPVLVLTGRLASNGVSEREVDAAVNAVRGELMEKPARAFKVVRFLQKGLRL
jgi:CheY-like chemotaxis protein